MTGGNVTNDYEMMRNHFSLVKSILWEDIIDKWNYEVNKKTHNIIFDIGDTLSPPTFVMHSDYLPNNISRAYTEVCETMKTRMGMHLYTSFSSKSNTFGRHKDDKDVLIVQSIGKVAYKFDDENVLTLCPGDSLFIKQGVYHNPFVLDPRVTLSFSWLNNDYTSDIY